MDNLADLANRSNKRQKDRGSVKNKSRLDAFAKETPDGAGDWGGCDSRKIQAVITEITERGGAVIFALSRDQGAHNLTLLLDDRKMTLWFNREAVLDDELDTVVATLQAMPGGTG